MKHDDLIPMDPAGTPTASTTPQLAAGTTLAELVKLSLLRRPKAEGLYFNRQIVKLDGYNFVRCRFDACRLTVASTNFEISHCIIDDNSVIEYGGETIKLLQLYNSRYGWVYDALPTFAPTRHPEDGTISIVSPT